ncbi:hypothetical protein OUZ56_025960 [Daphnia magna]|uniref:Uncharacterized protein n=1 Tax=Daphnia magna TaxID=35525 RepID=A0ABQ9ZKF7_9CRUS|nr:hypothetical protein OUZ56_025960 [Daphnia magna]
MSPGSCSFQLISLLQISCIRILTEMMTRQMHPRGPKIEAAAANISRLVLTCGGGLKLNWNSSSSQSQNIPSVRSIGSRSRSMSKLEWARSVAGMEVKTVLEELNHWFKRNPLLFSIEIIRCDHSMASSSRLNSGCSIAAFRRAQVQHAGDDVAPNTCTHNWYVLGASLLFGVLHKKR